MEAPFFFNDTRPCPVPYGFLAVLDGANPSDVDANRRVEFKGVATRCCFRIAKHDTDLHTDLVDKNNRGHGLSDGTGQLS